MPTATLSAEVKAQAVTDAHALVAQGLSANKAAEQVGATIGVTVRTVQTWAEKAGQPLGAAAHAAATTAKKVADARTEQAKAQYAADRASMRTLATRRAIEALDAMPESKPRDRQALAMVFAILLDKIRLEEGQVTGRTETITPETARQTLEGFLADVEAAANSQV